AIPAGMFAYILSGLVATVVFARNKSIDWRMAALHRRYAGGIRRRVGGQHFRCPFAGWLPRSAHPFVGSKFVTAANSRCNRSCHVIPRFIGAGAGFLSSLTGTGGPLLLVPILLTMQLGVLASVGLSQIFQLPVAIAATL